MSNEKTMTQENTQAANNIPEAEFREVPGTQAGPQLPEKLQQDKAALKTKLGWFGIGALTGAAITAGGIFIWGSMHKHGVSAPVSVGDVIEQVPQAS